MSKGQAPEFKLVIPAAGTNQRVNIGAEWQTANQEVFSCRMKLPFDLKAGEELSFIRVPNTPKGANDNPNNGKPEPVRNGVKRRQPQGEQPRGAA
jgi:hypothetical protein